VEALVSTMFVTSAGGHLSELLRIAERLEPCHTDVWVTPDHPHSRAALADRNVEFVPDVAPRHVGHLLRALPAAGRVLRSWQPQRAVSAGAGVALAFLPYLAARGVSCHYVESATRVSGPSLTGRVLTRTPRIRLYCRYPSWADGRWVFAGNDLDAFRVVDTPRPVGEVVRVLVTLGTGPEPFDRLLRPLVDVLRPDGPLERALNRRASVWWQIGPTTVPHGEIVRLQSPAAFAGMLSAADIVVTHAGVGCTIATLQAGVLPVLVPRRPPHETPDGHQAQFVREIQRRGLGLVTQPEELTAAMLTSSLDRRIVECPPGPFPLRSP
jgi:UDP-N-acetylglucosamine--N-acetylmuramyl-(pentapeptide) pyrophosphoryl-undecaprenol N-acetylglucosamine transferase